MVKRLLFLIVLAASLLSTEAMAQPGKWRTYYESAKQAFTAGRYADAVRLLEEAHRLSDQHALLYNIGKASQLQYIAEKNVDALKKAVRAYRDYLEKVPEGSRRVEATEALGELEPQLPKDAPEAPVNPDDPYGEKKPAPKPEPPARRTGVVVTTSAPGARIILDNNLPTGSPLVAETTPGMHTIIVQADGFIPAQRQVRIDAGVELALDIPLRVQPASISVKGPNGASVYVNGKHMGDLPLREPLAVEPGEHFIAVTQNGHLAFTQSLALPRGAGVHVAADLQTTPQRYASYAMFLTGAVGIIVGASLTAAAVNEEAEAQDLEDQRSNPGGVTVESADAFDDAVSSRDDFRTGAIVAFGASVGLLATGFFLYLLDEPEVATPPRRGPGPSNPGVPGAPGLELGAAPIIGPHGGGGAATLKLRF